MEVGQVGHVEMGVVAREGVLDLPLAPRPERAKRDGTLETRLAALVTQVRRGVTAVLIGAAAARTRVTRHRPCNNIQQPAKKKKDSVNKRPQDPLPLPFPAALRIVPERQPLSSKRKYVATGASTGLTLGRFTLSLLRGFGGLVRP